MVVTRGCPHWSPSTIKNKHVTYVVPDMFRGTFKILMNRSDGVVLAPAGDEVHVVIPRSGVLKIRGTDPMLDWNVIHARFESGEPIAFPLRPEKEPTDAGLTKVHHLGYYRRNSESWYFVGTGADADRAVEEAIVEDYKFK